MTERTCSEHSLSIGEPLAGSAVAGVTHWLVVEHAAPWGPNGLEDSGLPEQAVSLLKQLGKRYPHLRVQLARKSAGSAETSAHRQGPRVFLADASERRTNLRMVRIEEVAVLADLPLDAWLRGEQPNVGSTEHEPLFLVCVHGKRDRCCAQLGLPVYRELEALAGNRVLQTTHLGGHRFAATLIVLPHGLCYGRVPAVDAPVLHEASLRDQIYDLSRLRGRSCYTSEAQAAEVALRVRLDERRADAFRLMGIEARPGDHFHVRFLGIESAIEHVVKVERRALTSAPASCGTAAKPAHAVVPLQCT